MMVTHEEQRRADIVSSARSWLGTPYHHRASLRGVGVDCLGLVRGVFRDCVGAEPLHVPDYSPRWADADGGEPLLKAAQRVFVPVPIEAFTAGDVLVFRVPPAGIAKHAGIATEPDRMIHAHEAVGVVEIPLSCWWRRRIAGAFAFPEKVS